METLIVKKKRLDIQRVETAMLDLEVRSEELVEEITRLKGHIQISKESLTRLYAELKQLMAGE